GVGAGWFVEHHPELVRDAEFLVNEGGTIRLNEDRGVEYYGVGTTEKSPFWLQLVARGTAGHGSRPTPDNPVHRLIRGVARVAAFQTPLVVTPPVDRYFRDLATIEPDAQRRAWFQDIRAALRDTAAVRAIVAAAHARHPGVLVTTPPLAGFTDSHFFRNLGIVCYGVSPFPVSEADSRGVHGNNERLSLDALAFGVHFMYDVIASVAAK